MPKLKFTDLTLQRIHDPGSYWDTSLRAFGLRVGKFSKTFLVVRDGYRTKIGAYPAMSLQDARQEAKQLLAHPKDKRALRANLTASEAIQEYLSTLTVRPTTEKGYRHYLQTHVLPVLCQKKLSAITRFDLLQVLDPLNHLPTTQRHTYAVLRLLLNWCVHRGYLTASPLAQIKSVKPGKSRTRVLTDDELRLIWRACEKPPGNPHLPEHFALIVQLAILTGQRRGELAAIQPSWIKNEHLVIPADVAKNGRQHSIPLSATSLKIATGLSEQRLSMKRYTAWSKPKERLDAISGVTDWTLHDLRRTFAYIHGRIGTSITVCECLLNHVSGTRSGIVAVYQRYGYEKEMLQAMLNYQQELDRIFAPA